jgi:hypothetical protein
MIAARTGSDPDRCREGHPGGFSTSQSAGSEDARKVKVKCKSEFTTSGPVNIGPTTPSADDLHAGLTARGPQVITTQNLKSGERRPLMPLSEVGQASRFGDKTLRGHSKCTIFEVVLQTKEQTACPACMRSPRRAALPAHARGCFGLS